MKTKNFFLTLLCVLAVMDLIIISSTAPASPLKTITDLQVDEKGYVTRIALDGRVYDIRQKLDGFEPGQKVYHWRPFVSTSLWTGDKHIKITAAD